MIKIPYEIVSMNVQKLYTVEFDSKDISGINEHCEFIRSFIESCGWSIDDYLAKMWAGDKVNGFVS